MVNSFYVVAARLFTKSHAIACYIAFHHRFDAAFVERNKMQAATMAQATTVKT